VQEEVVVTGSRIVVPNEISISPVTAISPAMIQETGANRIEDVLNSMPQIYSAQNSNVSNGSDGTAQVDLRGLGARRTLVLVNGRRLGPGTPVRGGGPADLNQIPAELIERVDILTGGASSVYGADAVTGVVNFILNDHFQGMKFITDYGLYSHHNDNPQGVATDLAAWNANNGTKFTAAPTNANAGYQRDLAFIMGFNSAESNGNVTLYGTYRRVSPALQNLYDFSACSMGSGFIGTSVSSSGVASGHFSCAGSSTTAPGGRFRLVNQFGKNLPAAVGGGSKTIDFANPAGPTLVGFANNDRYNFGPLNYYQRPDERFTAGAFTHYTFNEHAEVYTEVQYVNDRTTSQIAGSGAFYGTGPYQLNCANPEFSANMVNTWCGGTADPTKNIFLLVGRRNVEGTPRRDDLEHQAWRIVVGDKGRINDVWTYDVDGSYAITQLAETYMNDVSISRVKNALNVVPNPASGGVPGVAAGTPVCVSAISGADSRCVPWNIFQPNAVTQGALAYISTPLVNRGQVEQREISGNTTGDLGKYGAQLPSAKSGLQVNVGAEWRQVINTTSPDLEYLLGDAAGQGAPTLPIDGQITSREGFLEARLPLIDEKPGAYAMAFETGYRYSNYSLGFNTNTYKYGLEWSPIQEVRVRGSWARAVRAPNSAELFEPFLIGLDGSTDPCSGAKPVYSPAQCAALQVTPAQYGHIDPNPAAQYNGGLGGNTGLRPESATTKSAGIGWTPSFLPGFRAQVDYWDIKIDNTIQRVGPAAIMQLCANSGVFCDRVHRDINGSLWTSVAGFVNDPLANQGALGEKGWDLDLSYRFNIGSYGKITTALVGTYMDSVTVTPLSAIPSTSFGCAGYYGPSCSFENGPNYTWRHSFRATWQTPWHGLDVSLAWRFFNSVKLDALSSNPNLTAGPGCTVANGCISNTDAKIPSISYLDMTAAIQISNAVSFRLGANNLLDKSPPVIGNSNCATSCNGNTYAAVYDTLGRYIFGNVTVQF
jgi:outer membrane receptor protein involved in Fe transport